MVNWWIKECLHSHTRCRLGRIADASSRPSRLIFVGKGVDHLRLCDKADVAFDAPYATLSHCWGQTKRHFTLRLGNISRYKARIDNRVLPRTILDAMVIARNIGTDYLWVDSLCIIQDSREDWLRESARMFHVYQNSRCNIAATLSSDDDGGCFSKSKNWKISPTRFRVSDTAAKIVPYLTSNQGLEGDAMDLIVSRERDLYGWQEAVSGARLQSRGWVLQEASACLTHLPELLELMRA